MPHDSLLASEYEGIADIARTMKSEMERVGKKTDVRESTNASDISPYNLYSPAMSKDPALFSADSRSKDISVVMTPKGKMKDLSPRLHELRRIKHSQMPNSFRQGRNNNL